jgi:hypothetical protein
MVTVGARRYIWKPLGVDGSRPLMVHLFYFGGGGYASQFGLYGTHLPYFGVFMPHFLYSTVWHWCLAYNESL